MFTDPERGSDEWWLDYLYRKLDEKPKRQKANLADSRRPNYGRRDWFDLLWSYRIGCPPLASYERQFAEEVQELQRRGRANYAGMSVQAMLDLIKLQGIRSTGDPDGDGDDAFRVILDDSGSWLADALDYTFTMGEGYVMVGAGPDGPVITAEDPRQCVAVTDPLDPFRVRAALKTYRDEVDDTEWCHLFIGDVGAERVHVAVRGDDGWSWDESKSGPLEFQGHGLPIVPLPNKLGMGEFEAHLDVLDRINGNIADRLWLSKVQAFRQRALIRDKDSSEVPEHDPATGERIDLNDIFQTAPNALWKMPEGWKVWESTPLDMSSALAATKDDVHEYCVVSSTPDPWGSDNVNQSGQGAKNVRSALTDKAGDRETRHTPAVRRIARLALAAAGKGDLADAPIEVMWAPIDVESLDMRGQAAVSAQSSGVPWEIVMTDVWKFPPQTLARAKKLRTADLFADAVRGATAPESGVVTAGAAPV